MTIYKRIGSFILSLLLVFSMFGSTFAIQTFAATSPALSAESKTVNAGEQFTVAVSLANATTVYGGNFTLQYDSDLLTADSYEFGSIVSGHTKNCNLDYQSAGNLIRVTFSGAEALSSSGTLVTFTFTAKEAVSGSAALQFNAYKMYDENGSSIDTTATSGNVTVKPQPDNVWTGQCGDSAQYEYNLDTKSLTITGTGEMWDYSEYLSDDWSEFLYHNEFSELIIEEGIATIGDSVFKYQQLLESVNIPNSVLTVDDYAFYKCENLKSVILGNSVEEIGDMCFNYCTSLAEINIPNTVKNIGVYAFSSTSLSSVKIPDSVVTMGYNAFAHNDSLISVEIGDGVSTIEEQTFYGCPALSQVDFGNNIEIIDDDAFYCSALTELVIPDSVHTIGKDTFMGCELTSLEVGDNLQTIGSRAFCNNYIYEVTLHQNITEIGEDAFDGFVTIYGYKNSTAENYANTYGNEFIALDGTSVENVTISSNPTKTAYYIGDSLSTSGLKLLISYSDGTTETVTSGFTTSGFSSTSAGTKTVTVSYEGFTDTFTVTVKTPSITLSASSKSLAIGDSSTITATTTPSGQTVTWTSSNTSVATVSGGTITAKASGSATITAKFTYNGTTYSKTCSVTVADDPEPTPTSLSVSSKPTKTTYEIGESLNTSGLKLKLTYSDGTYETISSGFTTSGFSSTTSGTKTVTVKYGDLTTTFTVTVNEIPVDGPRVIVESKKARVGSTVLITVSLEENLGIWGMDLVVNYDKTQLTLTNVTNGTVFSSSEWTQGNLSGDKYILSYEASGFDDITTNGLLATLEFTVSENATVDSFSSISLSYNTGDIINVSFDDINVAVVSGGIDITDFVYGDLNSDGLVNKKDSLLMKMYLADNSTTIDMQAADVYVDGSINKKDSLYLKQYLAGLDVELGA